MESILILIVILTGAVSEAQRLVVNPRARQLVHADGTGRRFNGAAAGDGQPPHLRLLAVDRASLLIGARGERTRFHCSDAVYNLSAATLELQHSLDWAPPAQAREDCMMKGRTKEECANFVRVLARQADGGRVLVCGTHAFAPKCREYEWSAQDRAPVTRRQFDGQALAPPDPRQNSTAVLVDGHELWTGTVADFAGNDPLIYRRSLDPQSVPSAGLRTQRDDLRVLDAPNFVGSFVHGEHVYFWYRERAAEALDNNEERRVYARVARLCRNDRGGARPAHEKFTSFAKARLNCSLAGDEPTYFDHLQSVTAPVGVGDAQLVYAVFGSADGPLRSSAVCSFRMDHVRLLFEHSTFKQQVRSDSPLNIAPGFQRSPTSVWSALPKWEIPRPRPTACAPDSRALPEQTVAFALRNPLLHDAVTAQSLLMVHAHDRAQLTAIAVLPAVRAVADTHRYNVLYVGTVDGRVLKLVELPGDERRPAALAAQIEVFANRAPIVSLLVEQNQLLVVSSSEAAALPLHHCGQQTSCAGCVRLQDPHCAWDQSNGRCVGRLDGGWGDGSYVQNLARGESDQCPEGLSSASSSSDDDAASLANFASAASASSSMDVAIGLSTDHQGGGGGGGFYSTQTVLLTALVTSAVALLLGFAAGMRASSIWRSGGVGGAGGSSAAPHSASSSSGSDYDSFGRARLTRHDSLGACSQRHPHSVYGGGGGGGGGGGAGTTIVNGGGVGGGSGKAMDAVSLVLSQHGAVLTNGNVMSRSGAASGAVTPRHDRSLTLSQATLPRDYRVKKVYL